MEPVVLYDNTFRADFENSDSAATAALESIITRPHDAYGANACVQLEITSVGTHCNDANYPYANLFDFSSLPFTKAQINDNEQCPQGAPIFNGFTNFWKNNSDSIVLDAALFFSRFEDGTDRAGRAFHWYCVPHDSRVWLD